MTKRTATVYEQFRGERQGAHTVNRTVSDQYIVFWLLTLLLTLGAVGWTLMPNGIP